MSTTILKQTVDQLADVRARIAVLRKEEDELKDFLIDSGERLIDSDKYHCVVSLTTKTIIDWKTVAMKSGASRQLIKAHTKQGDPAHRIQLFAHKAG